MAARASPKYWRRYTLGALRWAGASQKIGAHPNDGTSLVNGQYFGRAAVGNNPNSPCICRSCQDHRLSRTTVSLGGSGGAGERRGWRPYPKGKSNNYGRDGSWEGAREAHLLRAPLLALGDAGIIYRRCGSKRNLCAPALGTGQVCAWCLRYLLRIISWAYLHLLLSIRSTFSRRALSP